MNRRSLFPFYPVALLLLLAAATWAAAQHMPHFTGSRELARYLRSFGMWTVAASIVLMIVQTILTPIPLFVVAGANGFIFGVLRGTVITLTGAMIGASVAFYLARFFRCGFLERKTAPGRYRLAHLDTRTGPRLVLLARLVPVIPSSVISYLAGLSRMSFSTFFLVSVVGKLPEIVLYTFLGRTLGHARSLDLWITAGVLLMPTVYFSLMAKKHLAGFFIGPNPKE